MQADTPRSKLLLGWSTVETQADANRIAQSLVSARLAACVQIDGPISSHYLWENKLQVSQEYRLLIKFLPDREKELETWLHQHHPYEIPEWVVVNVQSLSEKYLSWAQANCSSAPF